MDVLVATGYFYNCGHFGKGTFGFYCTLTGDGSGFLSTDGLEGFF